jgi:fucose permease
VVGANLLVPAVAFVLVGIGVGVVETARHSAVTSLAPAGLRSSAFGMLATVRSLGNFAGPAVAGVLWTTVSATASFRPVPEDTAVRYTCETGLSTGSVAAGGSLT